MNPPRHKYGAPGKYGPAPAQGKLPLGSDGNGATKLEKRLAEDPELLRRIAEFAAELGGEDRVEERPTV
jgi:hypothetical protein